MSGGETGPIPFSKNSKFNIVCFYYTSKSRTVISIETKVLTAFHSFLKKQKEVLK